MEKARTIMPNGRYTDDELGLLKKIFAENMPLLKVLRKVMLQLPMSEAEHIAWKKTFNDNEELGKLMRKMFLPTIDGDAPIHQVIDLWMTVNLENKMPDEAESMLASRGIVIKYLDIQLRILSGTLGEDDSNKSLTGFEMLNPEELRARNTIVAHVENQLGEINGLAGFKKETSQETLERLAKNSSK